MLPVTGREARLDAGFTLIEALAALAVMSAGLAAIGALSNSSLRTTLYTERRVAEIENLRTIVAGMPGRNALPFGRMSGSLNGYEWRINASRALTTPERNATTWVPQSIALVVRSPSGALVEVDTIRLRKAPAK